jgi:hypothetical protein
MGFLSKGMSNQASPRDEEAIVYGYSTRRLAPGFRHASPPDEEEASVYGYALIRHETMTRAFDSMQPVCAPCESIRRSPWPPRGSRSVYCQTYMRHSLCPGPGYEPYPVWREGSVGCQRAAHRCLRRGEHLRAGPDTITTVPLPPIIVNWSSVELY